MAASLAEGIAGGLLGVAAGDALGSTLEFLPRAAVASRYRGGHRELTGGGAFGWRPGQGTDDSDLTWAVVQAYLEGYSVAAAAEYMLAWFQSGPRDVGATTAAALAAYRRSRDPRRCGAEVAGPLAAGNGSLMRALPTALVRGDAAQRAAEAAELSRITHADRRCVESCVAYGELAATVLEGAGPAEAIEHVLAATGVGGEVRAVLARAPHLRLDELPNGGFVLDTLAVATWALVQSGSFEDVVVQVVNLGGDADTNGAVAGGLLGVLHGAGAVPPRWRATLEYADAIEAAAPRLVAMRQQGSRPLSGAAGRAR
ncbi:MAG TPA: ADP-ribosylglycohydrolase family protein [Acidimicrobiales bacterium]|nr:ADP-ribosylglycohydrolase family protein [Acidimicrobiales bacterium]